jgi:hypothetical protein
MDYAICMADLRLGPADPATCVTVPHMPGPRELVAHAYLLVRHMNLPGSPAEPPCLDLSGCGGALRDVQAFFRRIFNTTPRVTCGKATWKTLMPGKPPEGDEPASINEEKAPPDPTLFTLGNWDLSTAAVAKYKTHEFPLKKTSRRLLARLIQGKGNPVHIAHLKGACNSDASDQSFASNISRLRKHLQEHLGGKIDLPSDPIPYCDPDHYKLLLT